MLLEKIEFNKLEGGRFDFSHESIPRQCIGHFLYICGHTAAATGCCFLILCN